MQKALTREDLMYILDAIFKISSQPENAFQMLDDGLFSKDYHQDLTNHTDNLSIHIEQHLREIFDKFTVNDNGDLFYDNKPVNTSISTKEKNAIFVESDGLYVNDITKETQDHLDDNDIHVTQNDKDTWNNILQLAKDFALEEIKKLILYNYEIVDTLPTEDISTETVYLIKDTSEVSDEHKYIMYAYLMDEWIKLNLTDETLKKFALKTDLDNYAKKDQLHDHENKTILDKFTETNDGLLMYNNTDISNMHISEQSNNAAQMIDGKLYVPDYSETITSMAISAAFTKENLLNEECKDSGKYELKGYIQNYNLLIIEYYYKPEDPNDGPGNAKTVIVDPDTLETLYEKGIDYILELGYGISVANSKIRMYDDNLWVNYYHGVCIYKITGIRRGDANG